MSATKRRASAASGRASFRTPLKKTAEHVATPPLFPVRESGIKRAGADADEEDPFAAADREFADGARFNFCGSPTERIMKRARLSLGGAATPGCMRKRMSIRSTSLMARLENPQRVNDRLFLGSRLVSMQKSKMLEIGATHILSLDPATNARFGEFFEYTFLPVPNDKYIVVLEAVLAAAQVVKETMESADARLLIIDEKAEDCACMVVLAYFIVHLGMTFTDALAKVDEAEGLVIQNESFLQQLRYLDSEVFRSRSQSVDSNYEWWLAGMAGTNGQREPTPQELELTSIVKATVRRLTIAGEVVQQQNEELEEAQRQEKEARGILQRVVESTKQYEDANMSELEVVKHRLESAEGELEDATAINSDLRRQLEVEIARRDDMQSSLDEAKREHVGHLQLLYDDVTRSEQEVQRAEEEKDVAKKAARKLTRERDTLVELNAELNALNDALSQENMLMRQELARFGVQ